MATYCLSNFVKDPSVSDRLMFISNCAGVLVVTIDPYASTFFKKSNYVYVVTDGKMNYDNVLDFDTETTADLAVSRLNDVKKIFIDRTNNILNGCPTLVTNVAFNAHTANTYYHVTQDVSDLRYVKLTGDTMTGDLSVPSLTLQTIVTGSTSKNLLVRNAFGVVESITVDSIIGYDSGKTWLDPVNGFSSYVTCSGTNERYISIETLSGWTINNIYQCDGSNWIETIVNSGDTVVNIADNKIYIFGITGWTGSEGVVPLWSTTSNNNIFNTNIGKVLIGKSVPTFSANTKLEIAGGIAATTYYGDGSNLTGLDINNTFTTGATLSGSTAIFYRTDNQSYTLELSGLTTDLSAYFTSAQTVSNFLSANTNVIDLGGLSSSTIYSLISGVDNSLTAHTSLTGASNPHQISFYNLTSTAHTHLKSNISDFVEGNYVHTTGDESIRGNKVFEENVTIRGNVHIIGTATTIYTENLAIKDNLITINSGETNSGVTKRYAGIEVDRGALTNYVFLFDENQQNFRIGESENPTGGTQAVSTRQDTPIDSGLSYWNASEYRFDTSNNLIFNGSKLTVIGNISANTYYGKEMNLLGTTSGNSVLSIQGTQGQLFSVTDSLDGSLLSVNDISGYPILEVFSDKTTVIGDYLAPSLYATKSMTIGTGTTTIYSLVSSAYTGVFYDYIITGNVGMRCGSISAIWSGSTVNYCEMATSSIGITSAMTFLVVLNGNNVNLNTNSSISGYNIKTIIRSI